jgi:hypothetical protein
MSKVWRLNEELETLIKCQKEVYLIFEPYFAKNKIRALQVGCIEIAYTYKLGEIVSAVSLLFTILLSSTKWYFT